MIPFKHDDNDNDIMLVSRDLLDSADNSGLKYLSNQQKELAKEEYLKRTYYKGD